MSIRNMTTIVIVLALSLMPVYGEQGNFENEDIEKAFEWLDRKSGISNMAISSMFQDKFGFVWFGTQGGLNRFDGNEVITFRNDPFDENSLLNNLIQTMYYDQDTHHIWIGTYRGVSLFDIDTETFTSYTVDSVGLSDSVVTAITKDSNGFMWFGTLNGLNKFEPATHDLSIIEVPEHVIRDIEITYDGKMFLATYDGLYFVESDHAIKYDLELPSNYVMTIEEFDRGVLTLGLWDGGIVTIDMDENISKIYNFTDNRVYCMTTSEDGTLWVGTWGGGLFTLDSNGIVKNYGGTSDTNDISHPLVYSLMEDDSNIMWIGTNGGGVSTWNPRKKDFVAFRYDANNENTISHGKVNVIKEINNMLYFGLYNEGLNIYDPSTEIFIKFKISDDENNIHNNTVNDLLVYQEKIVIATNRGLTIYDKTLKTFTKWPIVDQEMIVYSLEVVDETLWIGTYGHGVYEYNSENNELKQYNSANSDLSDDIIYDIFKDSKERLWIGTNDGLNVIYPDDKLIYNFKNNQNSHFMPSDKFQIIYEDSKDHLWFGTSGGGITHYNSEEDTYINYTEKDGLSSNDILGILEDGNNNFWIATNDGVSMINTKTTEILNYTPDDGIGGWEFSRGQLKTSSGQLFFGGVHGVTEIPSTLNPVVSKVPRVYITNISSIDKDLKPSLKIYNNTRIDVPANESYIAFDVVAIEFDAPDKITFSYQLEGHDKQWIHLGNNKRISYSNLSPGNYKLKVQVNSATNILSTIEHVEITILTPWYLSVPMYFLYAIILVFFTYILLRLRQAKVNRIKNTELSNLNSQLEEMNMSLEQLAIKDPLTGVYNRRYFKMELENQLSMARRGQTSIAILMIDLDDFKMINDTYGHIEGDHLLIYLCQKIHGILFRKTDFISRYGGDEFAIVLYDTDEKGALKIANDIMAVSRTTFMISDNEINMHMSIGMAVLIPDEGDTIETVIRSADKMLYKAKESGKNKICYK